MKYFKSLRKLTPKTKPFFTTTPAPPFQLLKNSLIPTMQMTQMARIKPLQHIFRVPVLFFLPPKKLVSFTQQGNKTYWIIPTDQTP